MERSFQTDTPEGNEPNGASWERIARPSFLCDEDSMGKGSNGSILQTIKSAGLLFQAFNNLFWGGFVFFFEAVYNEMRKL